MDNLKQKAQEIRLTVLDMIYDAQTSHIGSNFSCIDILTVLYEKVLRVDKDLKDDRDKMVYSKGWVAATAYAFLADKGIIPKKDLKKYCKANSKYIGLLEPYVRGVECAGGSMGYGLPFGVGFALAQKLKGQKAKTYVLMSDGDQAIGTTWESALIASHHKLNNLMVIVDYNKLQAMGPVSEVLGIEPLKDKWKAFGWEVRECSGHHFEGLLQAMTYPPLHSDKPIVVIAHTTKGCPVSFMRNNNLYHYKNLSKEEYEKAKAEIQYHAEEN